MKNWLYYFYTVLLIAANIYLKEFLAKYVLHMPSIFKNKNVIWNL